MRKIIVLATIMILTLILTSCAKGNSTAKQQAPNPKGAEQAENAAASSDNPQQVDKNSSQQPKAQNPSSGSASIIAKSENVMSNSDKEALLNQVDQELDSLFSNINNLEDAQDTDLDLNQK